MSVDAAVGMLPGHQNRIPNPAAGDTKGQPDEKSKAQRRLNVTAPNCGFRK